MSPDSCYRVSTDWNGIPPQELDRGRTLKSSLPSLSFHRIHQLVIFFFFLRIFKNRVTCFFLSLFAMLVGNGDISRLVYLFLFFFLLFLFSLRFLILLDRTAKHRRGRSGQWQRLSVEARAFTAITCNFDVLRLTLLAMNARTFNALVNADNWGLLDPLSLVPWPWVVVSLTGSLTHPQTVYKRIARSLENSFV